MEKNTKIILWPELIKEIDRIVSSPYTVDTICQCPTCLRTYTCSIELHQTLFRHNELYCNGEFFDASKKTVKRVTEQFSAKGMVDKARIHSPTKMIIESI